MNLPPCTGVSICRIALPFLLGATLAYAQPQLSTPQPSPKATISQVVGITKMEIVYSRPGVKDRKIWGELVPYGQVWRAGANENTTISFADPVRIGGKELAAGTYGLHMIPTAKEWTIIFSRSATSWGSFFYKENEDALRVTVTPLVADHQEWLSYEFNDLTRNSVVVSLRWEKLRVPFTVELDVNAIVLTHARNEHLRGLAGFSWQGFNQAAMYCLQNNVNTEEGLRWADQSIAIAETFANLRVKAGLLEKSGNAAEVKALRDRSMEIAQEADINTLGYQMLGENKFQEAIDLFKRNVKNYPKSWNVYDSLGEGYDRNGQKKLAIEFYNKALSMVKDDANKKRINDILKRLEVQ
jgi:hypothetical protein